jgi:hypothetical protein
MCHPQRTAGMCANPPQRNVHEIGVLAAALASARDTARDSIEFSCDAMPGTVRRTRAAGGGRKRTVRDLQQTLAIQAVMQQERNNVRQARIARKRLHDMFASHADDLFVSLRLAMARLITILFTLGCRGNVCMCRPHRPRACGCRVARQLFSLTPHTPAACQSLRRSFSLGGSPFDFSCASYSFPPCYHMITRQRDGGD